MRVLVACEESQAVCKAFRELGAEAYSCDIIDCSGGHPEWHIKGDVRDVLNDNWDMIIAFPPCTYFTTASACRLYHIRNSKSVLDDERYQEGLKMKELWNAIKNASCKYISMENPTPMKIWELGKPSQIIQPYMFGHPFTKRTCLWLKGLKPLEPTVIVEPYMGSWVNAGKNSYKNGICNGKTKALDRSKTFPGIAKAMATQWTKQFLEENNETI